MTTSSREEDCGVEGVAKSVKSEESRTRTDDGSTARARQYPRCLSFFFAFSLKRGITSE